MCWPFFFSAEKASPIMEALGLREKGDTYAKGKMGNNEKQNLVNWTDIARDNIG